MNDRRACELLLSPECPACHGTKKPRHTLCKDCYFALPRELRNALYKRLGTGYTQALNHALEWLASHRHAV